MQPLQGWEGGALAQASAHPHYGGDQEQGARLASAEQVGLKPDNNQRGTDSIVEVRHRLGVSGADAAGLPGRHQRCGQQEEEQGEEDPIISLSANQSTSVDTGGGSQNKS